jgi:hypothetical protein
MGDWRWVEKLTVIASKMPKEAVQYLESIARSDRKGWSIYH